MAKYWQEDIESMPYEDMKKLQNERLVKQVRHVYENVPYYKALMDEKGVTPDDIQSVDDLHKLPFLTKADLREAYPYGLLAKPLSECVRIHSTSGTTGKRVVAFYTQHDIDLWEDCCARAIVAAGGTKEDVVQVAYGYGLFTGGLGALVAGSKLLLASAVFLSSRLGIPDSVVALTVVAVGTSLPELATSVVAAVKGERDIAIGNVAGSNIFNLLGIMGLSSLLAPIRCPGIGITDISMMVFTALILWPIMKTGHRISRAEGVVLLLIYVAYTAWLIHSKC